MSSRLLSDACDAPAPFGSLAAKLLLIKLVDCCDDDGRNIWPKRAVLARAACCSERHVRDLMGRFCGIGLLRRIKDGGKGPGSVNRYEMDVAVLKAAKVSGWPYEADTPPAMHAAHDGDADEGCETAENEADKGELSSPLEALRGNWGAAKGELAAPVYPLEDYPLDERKSASARQAGKGTRPDAMPMQHAQDAEPSGTPTLYDFRRAWPTTVADDQVKVANAWSALGFEERRAAVEGIPGFLASIKKLKRDAAPAGFNYLAQKRWTLVAAEERQHDGQTRLVVLEPWSLPFMAVLLRRAASGEPCAQMLRSAAEAKASTFRLADLPGEGERSRFKGYPAHGEVARRWRDWLAGKGVRLPDFGATMWLQLPGEWPPGTGGASQSIEQRVQF